MPLFFQLQGNLLVTGATYPVQALSPLPSITIKAGSQPPETLTFLNGSAPVLLLPGSVIQFGAAQTNFASAPAVLTDFTNGMPTDGTFVYSANADYDDPALLTALAVQSPLSFPCELRFRQPGDADWTRSCNPVMFTAYAPVLSETAASDENLGYVQNLPLVTQRTGAIGDVTALANVPTAGRHVGEAFSFTEAATGNLAVFRLTAGTAQAGNANEVAPADFNAVSNVVYFQFVSTGATGNFATASALDAETAAREEADALMAPLDSPALTGVPTAPTAAPGTNTTQVATTEFVEAGDTELVASINAAAAVASAADTPAARNAAIAAETERAEMAETALTGNTVTVEMYGATGNGISDDSAAIQSAINAQASAGGGIVLLNPQRSYGVSPGGLTIPAQVSLVMAQSASMARHFVSFGAGDAGISAVPPAGGKIILLGGSGGTDQSAAYLTLAGARSALVGASLYDPDQAQTLSAAVAKPFAVRLSGDGASVSRLELVNPYYGVDVRNGQCAINHLSGNPLCIGLRADECYDTTRITDCHFADSWVRGTTLATWFAANATAFSFLDNDEVFARGLFSYAYRTGLLLAASTVSGRQNHGTYGVVSDSGFDGALYGISDSATQGVAGMSLSRVGITNFGYSAASSYGYYAGAGKTGLTMVQGCAFWGANAAAARISGGAVRVLSSDFLGTSTTYVLNDGPASLDIMGNRFGTAAAGAAEIMISTSGSNGRVCLNMTGANSAATRVSNASGILVPTYFNGGPLADSGALSTTTSGIVRSTGSDNAPTSGVGAELLLYAPNNKGYCHVYDRGAGTYLPLVLDGPNEMPSLATSDPHIAGRLWSNGGVVTVSAG